MAPKSIEQIFHLACEVPPEQRSALLKSICNNDPTLISQVESLLQADRQPDSILDQAEAIQLAGFPQPPRVGDFFGNYELIRRIGDGGMGLIFLAQQQEPVRRQVAIKVIPNRHICSDEVLCRFSAERQVLAMFDHPNVTKVFDGGITDDGLPYFVMEHVKGQPITLFCNQRQLSIEQRLRIFIDTCRAFEHAHQRGVIHRDIKPSNILVSMDDGNPVPKVIDFGIAKALGDPPFGLDRVVTQHGAFMGTPQYMSPEQAKMDSTPVDVRTDVYSLGVLLYELLTGSPPITQNEMERMGLLKTLELVRDGAITPPSQRHESQQEPNPSQNACGLSDKKLSRVLRGDLDWIILAALAKSPADRYDSVSALREDIENYLLGNPVSVAAPSTVYRSIKFVSRNRIPCASFAVVIAVMISATVFSLLQARKSKRARLRSESLALQLKLEGRKLAAALENAKAGEAFKQNLLRIKKHETTVEKAFEKFIERQLPFPEGSLGFFPVVDVNFLNPFVQNPMLPTYAPEPYENYHPTSTCPQASTEYGDATSLAINNSPIHNHAFVNNTASDEWMLNSNMSPLTFLGLESLHVGSPVNGNPFPLLNDVYLELPFEIEPDLFNESPTESAIQFMEILRAEQLKEFRTDAPTVIDSQLLLAQLHLKNKSSDEARLLLTELARHYDKNKSDENRGFFVQLLLLQCDEAENEYIPQSKIDSLKSTLRSLEFDRTVLNQLLNQFPKSRKRKR